MTRVSNQDVRQLAEKVDRLADRLRGTGVEFEGRMEDLAKAIAHAGTVSARRLERLEGQYGEIETRMAGIERLREELLESDDAKFAAYRAEIASLTEQLQTQEDGLIAVVTQATQGLADVDAGIDALAGK